jgi:hypothetical protein
MPLPQTWLADVLLQPLVAILLPVLLLLPYLCLHASTNSPQMSQRSRRVSVSRRTIIFNNPHSNLSPAGHFSTRPSTATRACALAPQCAFHHNRQHLHSIALNSLQVCRISLVKFQTELRCSRQQFFRHQVLLVIETMIPCHVKCICIEHVRFATHGTRY